MLLEREDSFLSELEGACGGAWVDSVGSSLGGDHRHHHHSDCDTSSPFSQGMRACVLVRERFVKKLQESARARAWMFFITCCSHVGTHVSMDARAPRIVVCCERFI